MNARPNNLAQQFLAVACLIVVLAPAAARGDGSILFNGGGAADSKIESFTADVVDGSSTITITVWAKAAGFGENSQGCLVLLDETGKFAIQHGGMTNLYHMYVAWSGGTAQWNYGAHDTTWNCHQITYDLTSMDPPNVYINGAQVAETESTGASGDPPDLGVGYCVGNVTGGTNTWDGQIAVSVPRTTVRAV